MGRIKDRLIFEQKKIEVTNPAACLHLVVVCAHWNTTDGSCLPPSLINNFQAFEKRRERKNQSAYAKERKEAMKKVRRTRKSFTLHYNRCCYSL